MKRYWAIGIWTVFGASIVFHLWMGGVVVETKVESGEYFVLLRDKGDGWTPVSAGTFWVHLVTDYLMFAVCAAVALWAMWRWLWHEGFP